MQPILPPRSFLTTYKPFIRPHLEYGDVIYGQPANTSFSNKIDSVQYKAALPITGTIKGSSRDKLYQELRLEYLQQRRWMRRLCLLYKYLSTGQASHIYNLLPQMRNSHKQLNTFHIFACRTEYFKNYFFPYVINEWNKLDPNICSSNNYHIFCNAFLKFI